jgi:hypothetical protein
MKDVAKKTVRPPARHYFRFKVDDHNGNERVFVAKAKIRKPKKIVTLMLTAEDVRRSIKAKGVGNTQTCAMAMCAKAHAEAFSHPVEGFIDWYYRRAYVVSRLNAEGLPSECYVYDHNDDVAHLNDTKGGQQKLLQQLEANGDRIIRLHPPKQAKPRPGRSRGKNTGERSRTLGTGAKLRFAVAQLGGVPAA